MQSYNHVTLAGNLTRDPEQRFTNSGKAIGNLSLALKYQWKDANGEKKEEVSFIDCTAWGKTAEIAAQYARKGDPILVDGRLQQQTWEDKNGGGKRSKIVVVVEKLVLLGNRKSEDAPAKEQPKKEEEPPF